MRRHLPTTMVLLVFLLSTTACSYTPPKPASQHPEDYPFRVSKIGLTVAVRAFLSEEQLKETLSAGEDYLSNNVLPIQVLIRNDTQDEQLLRASFVRLVWSDGSIRSALTPSETFEAVKSSVAGGAIMMGVIGAAAASSQNENIMKDLTTVTLKDTNISPRASATGFAFFKLSKGDTSLTRTKLRVILQNPTGLTETILEIALGGDLPKSRGAVPPKQ